MSGKRAIVLTNWGCQVPFRGVFDSVVHTLPINILPTDTLILEGGTDINPFMYGQVRGAYTQISDGLRDAKEGRAFRMVVDAGGAILGICRGAQLATAKVGGKLIQHVTGHERGHGIVTKDGMRIWASSLHHQMMFPFNLPKEDYEVLAHSPHNISDRYLDDSDGEMELPEDFVEPEIVWYPKVRCLAIQGHPEYMEPKAKFVQVCRNLVEDYIHA